MRNKSLIARARIKDSNKRVEVVAYNFETGNIYTHEEKKNYKASEVDIEWGIVFKNGERVYVNDIVESHTKGYYAHYTIKNLFDLLMLENQLKRCDGYNVIFGGAEKC